MTPGVVERLLDGPAAPLDIVVIVAEAPAARLRLVQVRDDLPWVRLPSDADPWPGEVLYELADSQPREHDAEGLPVYGYRSVRPDIERGSDNAQLYQLTRFERQSLVALVAAVINADDLAAYGLSRYEQAAVGRCLLKLMDGEGDTQDVPRTTLYPTD